LDSEIEVLISAVMMSYVVLIYYIYVPQDADGIHVTETWPNWSGNEIVQSGDETKVCSHCVVNFCVQHSFWFDKFNQLKINLPFSNESVYFRCYLKSRAFNALTLLVGIGQWQRRAVRSLQVTRSARQVSGHSLYAFSK